MTDGQNWRENGFIKRAFEPVKPYTVSQAPRRDYQEVLDEHNYWVDDEFRRVTPSHSEYPSIRSEKGIIEFGPEFEALARKVQMEQYGEATLDFPYLCNTANVMPAGKPIQVPYFEIAEDPNATIIDHTMGALMGSSRSSNIQVIGGASGFPLEGTPTIEELLSGIDDDRELPDAYRWSRDIYRAAHQTGSSIVTGGTNGVMALISSIWMADRIHLGRIQDVVQRRASLLQVDPHSEYSGTMPRLIHVVPKATTLYHGNDGLDTENNHYPVAPCSGMLVVGGGGGWSMKGLAADRSSFVNSFLTDYDWAVDVMPPEGQEWSNRTGVLINGGYFSIIETALATASRAKLLVMKGTGRLADLVAASIENGYVLPPEEDHVWKQKSIRADMENFPQYRERLDILLNNLRVHDESGNKLAHVFDANSEGLTNKITSLVRGVAP